MERKTISIQFNEISLEADAIQNFFPHLENRLNFLDLVVFHENQMEEVNKLPVSKVNTNKKHFSVQTVTNLFIKSKFFRILEVWVRDSSTREIIGICFVLNLFAGRYWRFGVCVGESGKLLCLEDFKKSRIVGLVWKILSCGAWFLNGCRQICNL